MYLGRSDDAYLIKAFTNLSIPDYPRIVDCLEKGYWVKQQNASNSVKRGLNGEYAKFTEDLVREMERLKVGTPIDIRDAHFEFHHGAT